MNIVSSYMTTGPFGVSEECAKFVITDSTDTFSLNNVAKIGLTYTFSFWIKSDAGSSIIVNTNPSSTFTTSSSWEKRSVTFTPDSTDIVVQFDAADTYYIFHPQLELGNKVSDWTPAPEDVELAINEMGKTLREEMTVQRTDIISNSEEIILSALSSYVQTEDLDSFRTAVETQLTVLAGEISMRFTESSANIQDLGDDMDAKFDNIEKYITFSADNAITITSINNEGATMTLEIDNEKGIVFKKNGEQFGLWDGENFYTGNIVVEVNKRAQFGNFAFIPRTDGSLSFLKVGG